MKEFPGRAGCGVSPETPFSRSLILHLGLKTGLGFGTSVLELPSSSFKITFLSRDRMIYMLMRDELRKTFSHISNDKFSRG